MSQTDLAQHTAALPLDGVTERLRRALDGALAGPLRATPLSGGRSNPTYALTDGTSEWILRRPPGGTLWKSAHDVTREARVMSALADSAVPVPRVVDLCEDTSVLGVPYYVMDRIPGRTLRDRTDTGVLDPAQRRTLSERLVTTLVDLHEVDPEEVGLSTFGRPDGYLERQVMRWGQQWEDVRTPGRGDASVVHRMLTDAMPRTRMTGIVHGDYKLDNLLLAPEDPTRIVALLDWEMATLGDTLADIGYLVSLWDEVGGTHNPLTAGATAREGFPSAAEMVDLYASRRGVSPGDLGWYVAFSHYKLAVILQQIHHRAPRDGASPGVGDDVGAMVDPLIALAHDRLKEDL